MSGEHADWPPAFNLGTLRFSLAALDHIRLLYYVFLYIFLIVILSRTRTSSISAIMTAAISVGYFGASLMWSDHLHRRAAEYEVRLSVEQESETKEKLHSTDPNEKSPRQLPLEL